MEKITDVDCKSSDVRWDPERPGFLTSLVLPITFVVERSMSWRRYNLNILISAQILELKAELEETLDVDHDNQDWVYRNRLLNDHDTISMTGIKAHEIIVCRRKDKTSQSQVILRP